MDMSLQTVLDGQNGLITTAQVLGRGHDKWSLLRLVKSGQLLHLARGVYAEPSPAERTMTPEERHLRLARAGLLLYPDAALAGCSALSAYGLPLWGADLRRARLERPVRREVMTENFVIRPSRRADSIARVAQPAERSVERSRALVQLALDDGEMAGLIAADAALHAGIVTVVDVRAAAAQVVGWPRSGRVRTMVAHMDGRSESVGETRLRVGAAMAGLVLVPQVVVRQESGRVVARVDFMVEGTAVVVEFDGKVKYRGDGVEALMAEKRREDELRRLGYIVVRVTWADLARMPTVVQWIRAAVTASRGKVALHPTSQVG